MAQTLTVCQIGTDWAVRDVTGEYYGRSAEIDDVIATAHRLAARLGCRIAFSVKAKAHLQSRRTEPET